MRKHYYTYDDTVWGECFSCRKRFDTIDGTQLICEKCRQLESEANKMDDKEESEKADIEAMEERRRQREEEWGEQ